MALKPQGVDLHIDELVLQGFATEDRLSIGDAVQRELSRLIAESGLAELQGRPVEMEQIDAGRFQAAPGARAQSIGTQVAGAVYRGISSPAGKDRRVERTRSGGKQQ
jgi:hypothetical protein